MSDDEVIRFEITDHDLDNEFNFNRPRGKNKKEHQIYGMWAKDSDEEDNEDNMRQRTRKPKDYSAPIGFVMGGVQQAGKKKEEKKEIESTEASTSRPKFAPDSSDEEEQPSMPLESETAGIRRKGQGMRPANLGGNVGNWEKHTKGIGAKLLLQMGYKPGKGLGKDLQGISAPVEATVRKGRGAIGAYGPEKAALKAKREEEKRLKEKEEQEKGTTEKSYNWKKSHKGRYFYRDSDDVIQEGKPTMHTMTSSSLARVPVIDMTGREKRVLSGYHALRAAAPRFEHEPRRKCEHFAAPELAHNLALMVDCCEQDIIQNARDLTTAEDEIVVLERDLKECDINIEEQDEIIAKVQAILQRVEALNRPDLSLEAAYEVLAELKESYPMEYEMFGLGTIAGNIVSPLLSALLAPWQPLEAPDEPIPTFRKWRPLLTDEAYTSLLWQHFVPHLTTASELWNPRVPEPMLRAVNAWSEVCPPWVASEVLTRCVVPRVLAAVRTWDPTHDTQPVHSWVLPWHELAGSALSTSVYPLIRSRLCSALSAWHPSDPSAKGVLGAWRGAWPGALPALLQHHVAPKLEHALHLHQVQLLPADTGVLGAWRGAWPGALPALLQHHVAPKLEHALHLHQVQLLLADTVPAWQWCVEWIDLLGAPTIAAIASRALLPRWLAALAAWLNTNPPHATVLNSYTDFKKTFPEEILREPVVRDAFRKALDMMNRSTDIDTVEAPPPPRFTPLEPKETSRIADALASTTQQKSFSELLESRCVEKGITFVPIVGKNREGRPIYKIGDKQCYVIRNVIMYSEDSGRNFAPIGMDRLLNMVED